MSLLWLHEDDDNCTCDYQGICADCVANKKRGEERREEYERRERIKKFLRGKLYRDCEELIAEFAACENGEKKVGEFAREVLDQELTGNIIAEFRDIYRDMMELVCGLVKLDDKCKGSGMAKEAIDMYGKRDIPIDDIMDQYYFGIEQVYCAVANKVDVDGDIQLGNQVDRILLALVKR